MKHLLLLPVFSIFMLKGKDQLANTAPINDHSNYLTISVNNSEPCISDQSDEKMLASVFKKQDYCRVELKDFVFDVTFKIVSADVYFTGTNFNGVNKGQITSASLKPIKTYMDRCAAGTIVMFDNVKVLDPNNEIRTIQGASYVLF
ncbi:MAG TPA: GldM family protein [Ferruginibacter sp.]|nr:GldM family protein [Ferruginibacter sp.]